MLKLADSNSQSRRAARGRAAAGRGFALAEDRATAGWGRARVSAEGALLSGGIGLTVEAALGAVGVGTGPAGWIALGAGLGIDFLWNEYATPWIYEERGYDPSRNLTALQ